MSYIYNGQELTGQFQIGSTNFPAGWCEFQTPEALAELGITWQEPEPPPAPTPEEIIAGLVSALEQYYDATAQTQRYDNRLTCALRAGYAGPFQAEGTAFAIWMDTCNAYGYTVMGECMSGQRVIPTSEELIAELPVLTW